MTDTAEPWYPIPPDPLEHDSCGCGGMCDCNDPSEDVVLDEEKEPRDELTSGVPTTGGES